jgi:hypothetical protein
MSGRIFRLLGWAQSLLPKRGFTLALGTRRTGAEFTRPLTAQQDEGGHLDHQDGADNGER